jgi:hypothetical protein
MSVQQVDTQSEHRRRVAGEIIIVLRVAGEVDLSTVSVLPDALADSLAG